MKPIISVIIPIYNAEDYLRDCVDSLMCQISDEVEVILVDDGSTDSCPAICDEYARNDSRVKVVHKENGGLVSARKAGVIVASGDYIASQDADDWFDKTLFEKTFDIIRRYSPDIIHFDSIIVTGETRREVHSNLRVGIYDEADIQRELFPILIEDGNSKIFKNSITSNIFKKDLYKESQLRVDDRIRIGEDAVCVKPIIFRAKSIYIMSDCLGYYRINTNSMTKGHKPFDLNYPMLLGQSLEKSIDMDAFDFKEQVCRYIVHNLFNACASRFYSEKSYREIVAELNECLDDPYYKSAIKQCRFHKSNYRGILLRLALKYRWYYLMKLYCKSKFKSW